MPANMMAGRPAKADARGGHNRLPTLQLPAEYTGPIPAWPLSSWSPDEIERWNWIWRKPQAAMWARAGMEDVVARYVRNCLAIERGVYNVALAAVISEVRQQEDRLGRTPLSLAKLRWETTEEDAADVLVVGTRTRPRLRAIDPDEATDA